MAKPLNIKDHNASFIKFLIFFIITLAMAVWAIYFNFKLPGKELKMYKKDSDLLRIQRVNQEKYKNTLNEIMMTINSLDSNNNSKALVNSELNDKMDDLRRASNIDDSTASQRLNQVIFNMVNAYRNAKIKLDDCKNFDIELAKKEDKIEELRKDLADCKTNGNNNIP
jgi:hypothetical protein